MPLSLFFLSLFVFLFNLTAGSMIQNPFTFSEEFAKLRNPEKNNSEFEGVALSLIPEFDFAHVFSIYYTVRRLPEDWATVIFTSNTNLEAKQRLAHLLMPSDAQSRAKSIHVLVLQAMQFELYSCALLSTDLYKSIPSKRVLIFQSDSLLLRQDDYQHDRKEHRFKYLRDFYQYVYLGAPWAAALQVGSRSAKVTGANGGFSLRQTDSMIHLTENLVIPVVRWTPTMTCASEDATLSKEIEKTFIRWHHNPRSADWLDGEHVLASKDIHGFFSMESQNRANPLGLHAPWRFTYWTQVKEMFYSQFPELEILPRLLGRGQGGLQPLNCTQAFEEWVHRFVSDIDHSPLIELTKNVVALDMNVTRSPSPFVSKKSGRSVSPTHNQLHTKAKNVQRRYKK